MDIIPLTVRQKKIANIVKENEPITGEEIADRLNVTRAALRSDLAILTMSGILEARTRVGYSYTGKHMLNMFSEKIQEVVVKDIQSLPVAVSEHANAYDAMVFMFTEDVGSVFVVEKNDILIGIVSRKDLLKAALTVNGELKDLPVKMVMTPYLKLIVTYPDEAVVLAARKIIENEVDTLPVVHEITKGKKQYKLVGRLTKTNITRLFVDLAENKGRIISE